MDVLAGVHEKEKEEDFKEDPNSPTGACSPFIARSYEAVCGS